jgi:ABC-type sugar transport system ATPase subunit
MTGREFKLREVSRSYGTQCALSGVTLTLRAGEDIAVVGPSGCGKSTLLGLLAGLDAPDAGQVLMDGEVVSEPGRILTPPHQRHLAMVFQDLALWPNLSVAENVRLGLRSSGLPRHQVRARTHEALRICGIDELAKRSPRQLSGGQQQRVALARAIAARPAFLLLDEPFAGLDLGTKVRLFDEIRHLADQQHLTLVLVTHDPVEAMMLCRRGVVLDNGRVVGVGELKAILRQSSGKWLGLFQRKLREIADGQTGGPQ